MAVPAKNAVYAHVLRSLPLFGAPAQQLPFTRISTLLNSVVWGMVLSFPATIFIKCALLKMLAFHKKDNVHCHFGNTREKALALCSGQQNFNGKI